MCIFANRSSSNAWIIVLSKLTFVLLCTPFFSPLLHKWRSAVCALWLRCETYVSAMLAGALLTLFFAWNGSQNSKSWKQNKVWYACKGDTTTSISITGARSLTIVHSVFFVMIIKILFMLFSVYNTVQWAENEWIWSVLANGLSTNNLLGTLQEIILVISQNRKQTSWCCATSKNQAPYSYNWTNHPCINAAYSVLWKCFALWCF